MQQAGQAKSIGIAHRTMKITKFIAPAALHV